MRQEAGYAQLSMVMLEFFFFNDTATTEIYTLSLHDALPIWAGEITGIELKFMLRIISYSIIISTLGTNFTI